MSEKTFLDLVSTAPAWRVRGAIRRGADVHARDEQDLNALMLAAWTNHHPGTIKALLAAGLDVNTRHRCGWTPLMLASLSGDTPAVVTALIEAGAHVRDTDDNGVTPPHVGSVHVEIENRSTAPEGRGGPQRPGQ